MDTFLVMNVFKRKQFSTFPKEKAGDWLGCRRGCREEKEGIVIDYLLIKCGKREGAQTETETER